VGVVVAMAVSLLVVGAIALAMTEGMVLPDASQETDTQPTTAMETFYPGYVFTTPTPRPTNGPRLVAATTQPVEVLCPDAVPGWTIYDLQPKDSLALLAAARGVSEDQILAANCLGKSADISKYKKLLLPPLTMTQTPVPPTATLLVSTSTSTRTVAVCPGAPRTWIIYIVQSGDNLTRIAVNFNTTVQIIAQANCLASTLINPGDRIAVPNTPIRNTATRTALPPTATSRPVVNTPSFTPRPSLTPTLTSVPSTHTFTPTNTATPTATATNTFTATTPPATLTFTPTGTKLPTNTSTFTATATFTPIPSGGNH
jgi:LysM repeat protein